MTPKQLHDYFRSQVADLAAPTLWSEDDVYGYMDEAHKMFVRLTGGIADAETDDIVTLCFDSGEQFAKLDPRVLEVRDASRDNDGAQIDVFNIEDFKFGNANLVRRDEDYYFGTFQRGPSIKWRTRTGSPIKAIVLGMQRNKARAYPIPVIGEDVHIEVYRLPLFTLTKGNKADFVFEVDEEHHKSLVWWMSYLAFQKHDADTYSKTYSELYEKKFQEYCIVLAEREQERRRRKPRKVQYGGI